MLKSLKIENFRSFQSFELKQLGRINLLVGENNSGKTSILEAIQLLLCDSGDLKPLFELLLDRGEYLWHENSQNSPWFDIEHLFYNHATTVNQYFGISSINQTDHTKSLKVLVQHNEDTNSYNSLLNQMSGYNLSFQWQKYHQAYEQIIDLFHINNRLVTQLKQKIPIGNSNHKAKFVSNNYFSIETLVELFDRYVLHPEEALIYESLRIIEPGLQRIAPNHSRHFQPVSYRGGFNVLLDDQLQPIPIGSMGEGIWRMLGLVLALVDAKDKVLLIDDIDAGLHFNTIYRMWKLIWKTTQKFNIQIFATTHSRDCWESLAELVESENISEGEITIHRIERDKPTSVMFNEREMVIAAERGIEVR